MRKKILIILGIVLFVTIIGTDVYIQYKNIHYNYEYKKTKEDISVFLKKVEVLEIKESTLETIIQSLSNMGFKFMALTSSSYKVQFK